mgnify:CR=1 FL=1
MKVSPNEAKLIDMLLKGVKPLKIQENPNMHRGIYYAMLRKLVELGILEKIKLGQYRLVDPPYEIVYNSKELARHRDLRRMSISFPLHPQFKVQVTGTMIQRITSYYESSDGEINRKALAKELGIPKYMLNMEVLNLGLGQKERAEEDYELDFEMAESGC